MLEDKLVVDNLSIPILTYDCVVIGSGSAAFNAADWLYKLGITNLAVAAEGLKMGTSRNAGSDKQTYYKLSLSGGLPDSIQHVAADLFHGGGMDGDSAWTQAAGSVQSFMKLVNLGVPFPMNEYGEYVGYQTDHETRQRATSAGPLTSKMMTECLEQEVLKKQIDILDQWMAVEILTSKVKAEESFPYCVQRKVNGVLCINIKELQESSIGLCIIYAKKVIAATGGPAGCYYHSVYPESQTGMTGMLLEAGAWGANLHEWQYGLASVRFRWNVSGSYQQVLPRYISIDSDGVEREFLEDYFADPKEVVRLVFLKGYQWPFDSEKIKGSSMIDLLVYRETVLYGRRAYMDFRSEPKGVSEGFDGLDTKVLEYLKNSNALIMGPIKRLEKMNPLAIELFKSHGIDLYKTPLEVCICAQHHNGGINVDRNWQSCIQGLYVVGEAAGTFGRKRPGGSALNAGQVGSMRAAYDIAWNTNDCLTDNIIIRTESTAVVQEWRQRVHIENQGMTKQQLMDEREIISRKMSVCAGHIRYVNNMQSLMEELKSIIIRMNNRITLENITLLPIAIKNRDIFITQFSVLSAMLEDAKNITGGGAVYAENQDFIKLENYISSKDIVFEKENKKLITTYNAAHVNSYFTPVKPFVSLDQWFESVWEYDRERRKGKES